MTSQPTPNPRLALGLLVVIMALQAFFASTSIFAEPGAGGDGVRFAMKIAFAVYVALIAGFAFGVWRQALWARSIGLAVAAFGLALAGVQILAGEPVETFGLGMIIDGALLYYLSKASTRALFDA
jgi:hypothetical protein